MALVAKKLGDAGPLIVVGMPGPEPALDIRTVLFYSSRDVEWQQLPDQIERLKAAVRQYPAVDVMMEKSTAAVLAKTMVVRNVAEAGNTELARVSRQQ